MVPTTMAADLFQQLESNDTRVVEELMQKFHEQFNLVQDSWLLYGLYDYYMASNSIRSMEILVNIREPHHNYLFNRLCDSIKGSKNEAKVQALTLLGHILRKEPPWLYKITEHQLLRDLLKLLKTETDILLLLSALLVLVVLLPIVPSRMGNFLQDVFEIFSRLAAWNCSNPEKLVEDQMVHMQVALYALFQRLYGMYPCNFLAYLRNQYRSKDQIPIFVHTVKPMLDTVKMHPLLVTASKDKETTTERWKKMGAHDVVVECEKFTLDVADRCQHESCYLTSSFRSRSGTTNSTTFDSSSHLQTLKSMSLASLAYEAKDYYSPSSKLYSQTPPVPDASAPTSIPHSHMQGVGQGLVASIGLSSQEGTSPPEAAIEATPETTPVKDIRLAQKSQLPSTSAVRTLSALGARNWSIGSSSSTPNHSQPSSPMRKEASPFNFPTDGRASAFGLPRKDSYPVQKLQQLMQDRKQVAEGESSSSESGIRSKTPILHPTSPLRIIPTNEACNSHILMQRIESPVSQEDKEVLEIVTQGGLQGQPSIRQCDSVLQEIEGGRGTEEDLEACEQEHGSPCTAGGLHMPNSKSMNDFAKRVRRLRHHSQCVTEPERNQISTGSSPGNSAPFSSNTVRRANSCPEMKKSPVVPTKDNRNKTLVEADEEANKENLQNDSKQTQKSLSTTETQTENFWPMPYEHLFLGIFPSLETSDVKPSPAPSPAPLNVQQDKFPTVSPYEILDKYIEVAVRGSEKDATKCLKDQLQLLHQQLLFERHRRETHAFKNRRLLADAKNTKALEEHNSALRDQVQLQQRDIDNLKDQLESIKRDKHHKGRQACENVQYWEGEHIKLQQKYKLLKQENENMQREIENIKADLIELENKRQHAEAALLDATAEVKIAKEQAWAGEKDKAELEQVNKELLIAGEMQLRYQERLAQLPFLKRPDEELARFVESYNHELKAIRQQVESKIALLETYKARIVELEHAVNQSEERCSVQKRMLSETKEEYDVKLKAVESKYLTQLTIYRSLRGKMLEQWQRLEAATAKSHNSPETSSCHEVMPQGDKTSIAAGVSPHSSPLSQSLASSDIITICEGKEKNMQSKPGQTVSTASSYKNANSEKEAVVELDIGKTPPPQQPSSSFSPKKD